MIFGGGFSFILSIVIFKCFSIKYANSCMSSIKLPFQKCSKKRPVYVIIILNRLLTKLSPFCSDNHLINIQPNTHYFHRVRITIIL